MDVLVLWRKYRRTRIRINFAIFTKCCLISLIKLDNGENVKPNDTLIYFVWGNIKDTLFSRLLRIFFTHHLSVNHGQSSLYLEYRYYYYYSSQSDGLTASQTSGMTEQVEMTVFSSPLFYTFAQLHSSPPPPPPLQLDRPSSLGHFSASTNQSRIYIINLPTDSILGQFPLSSESPSIL